MFPTHARSLLLGLFAGVAATAGIAAFPGTPESSAVGRFQMEAAGTGTGAVVAYVLDTTTGQVWASGGAEFSRPKLNRPWPDGMMRPPGLPDGRGGAISEPGEQADPTEADQ